MASAQQTLRIRDIPQGAHSFVCLGYAIPGSAVAHEWPGKGPYCLYEFTSWAVDKHDIRWGDGSAQTLSSTDLDDVILLPAFGDDEAGVILDCGTVAPESRAILDAVISGDMSAEDAKRAIFNR